MLPARRSNVIRTARWPVPQLRSRLGPDVRDAVSVLYGPDLPALLRLVLNERPMASRAFPQDARSLFGCVMLRLGLAFSTIPLYHYITPFAYARSWKF